MDHGASLRVLGERIRATRKAAGFSQERLAPGADIDRSFMGQVERGQRNVSFSTLFKIARVLKADLGSFFTGLPEAELLPPSPSASLGDAPAESGYKARRPCRKSRA